MAEKFVTGIQQLTISAATYHGVTIKPTYINYFFGNNGVGKTTISREIAKLKRPANEISGGEIPEGVVFETGKTHRDYNILVYNQDFIKSNLQQSDLLPGVFMIDEDSIKQQTEIKDVKEEKEKAEKEYSEIMKTQQNKLTAMGSLKESLEQDVFNATKEIRDAFPETQKGVKRNKPLFLETVRKVESPALQNVDELKELYNTLYGSNPQKYDLFQKVSNINVLDTVRGIDLLGKRIVSSGDTDFAKFIKALNATDWVRQGHENYHDLSNGRCPYCQQKLPTTFEADLAECFDDEYRKEVASIKALLQLYKDTANAIWKVLSGNLNNVYPKIDITEYQDKMQILKDKISANIQLIEQKIKEPSSEQMPEKVSPILEQLNGIIEGFNQKISENNEIVRLSKEKKVECSNKVWQHMAASVSTIIKKFDEEYAAMTASYETIQKDARSVQEKAFALEAKLSEIGKNIVKTDTAIKNMNKMLTDSGFQGFKIQEHPKAKNSYQIVREDGSIASRLSEGEVNFIAFLYFCNLVHGNGSTGDAQVMYTENGPEMIADGRDMRDKIVVVDDPVSSMDSSALFIVSSLVRQMICICRNNIILEKDKKEEKGDYIKQMFILTHNAYFHREITVNQEKHYRSVSFYLITKHENKSDIKLCITKNDDIPTEKKNYNPVQNSYAALWTEYKEVHSAITVKNVIRRILEYYFIQICGYDGYTLQDIILKKNRSLFVKVDEVTGEEDTSELRMVSALISYITSSSFGVNDGLHLTEDCIAPEVYRDLMKKIFEAMHQTQHYEMMCEIYNEV